MKTFKDLLEEKLNEGRDRYPGDEMTMKELRIAINSAKNILDMIEDGAEVMRWQISAIVKASDELASVYTSLSADVQEEEDDIMAYTEYGYPAMYGEEAELDEARIDFNRIMKGADKNKLKVAASMGEADYKKGIYVAGNSKDLEKFMKDADLKTKAAYMAAWTKSNTAQRMKKEETELDESDTHKTKDGRTAKKGLWYNINKRREKGLPRKKPGDEGYPKTLDIKD